MNTCVPISGPVRSLRMGLLTTHGAEKSRTVQAFIDYARDQVRSGAFDAQNFLANDWKYAPVLRELVLVSESEPQILAEEVTAR